MAQVFDDVDFWLSREAAMKKAVVGGGAAAAYAAEFDFSRLELPYEFMPFESELSSPEEDLFAELNRRLTLSESRTFTPLGLRKPSEVSKGFGGSPQSTLGGIGSWSGRSSNESYKSPVQGPSPRRMRYDDVYGTGTAGLIYAAAGQGEKLKMRDEGRFNASVNGHLRVVSNPKSEMNHMCSVENHKTSFLAEQQNYLAAARRAYDAALLFEHHLQNLNSSARCGKPLSGASSDLLTQSQWQYNHARQQPPRVTTKASIQSASLQRKESVGTGVFLPRKYNVSPVAPPRKRDVATNAIVPLKVVQALNISLEEINSRKQPHYSSYAASMSQKNYEALMASRNAVHARQQGRVARADNLIQNNIEVCLPQEWSY